MKYLLLILIFSIGCNSWSQSIVQVQDSLGASIGIGKQYEKIVIKADDLFMAKNYVKALDLYERALSLKPTDPGIPAKIILTQNKMTCANCNTYERVIFKADNHYQKEEFSAALKLYKRSQVINPSDAYPQKMIDIIISIY